MVDLNVSYAERNKVKSAGAFWDYYRNVWCVNDKKYSSNKSVFQEFIKMSDADMEARAKEIAASNSNYLIFAENENENWLYYLSKDDVNAALDGKWILFTSLTSSAFDIFQLICEAVNPVQAKISLTNKFASKDNMMCFYTSELDQVSWKLKIDNALDDIRRCQPNLFHKFVFKTHSYDNDTNDYIDYTDKYAWKSNAATKEDWSAGGHLTQRLKKSSE